MRLSDTKVPKPKKNPAAKPPAKPPKPHPAAGKKSRDELAVAFDRFARVEKQLTDLAATVSDWVKRVPSTDKHYPAVEALKSQVVSTVGTNLPAIRSRFADLANAKVRIAPMRRSAFEKGDLIRFKEERKMNIGTPEDVAFWEGTWRINYLSRLDTGSLRVGGVSTTPGGPGVGPLPAYYFERVTE